MKHFSEYHFTDTQTAQKGAAVLTNGQVLFTVSGGPILVTKILGYCVTDNDATASTFQVTATPTVGTATTITGASASLASVVAGTLIICTLATAATAPAVVAAGVAVGGQTTRAVVPAGTINATVGVGSTTGTWEWFIQYEPLAPNVTVS
jgi:hypothetical protein